MYHKKVESSSKVICFHAFLITALTTIKMEKGYAPDEAAPPYPGPPVNYGGMAPGPHPGMYPQPGYPPAPGPPPQPGFQPGPYQGGECLVLHMVSGKHTHHLCRLLRRESSNKGLRHFSTLELWALLVFRHIMIYQKVSNWNGMTADDFGSL